MEHDILKKDNAVLNIRRKISVLSSATWSSWLGINQLEMWPWASRQTGAIGEA